MPAESTAIQSSPYFAFLSHFREGDMAVVLNATGEVSTFVTVSELQMENSCELILIIISAFTRN